MVERGDDRRPSQEDELPIALAGMWPDPTDPPANRTVTDPSDDIAAPVDSTVANPRFVVIPRVTGGMAW